MHLAVPTGASYETSKSDSFRYFEEKIENNQLAKENAEKTVAETKQDLTYWQATYKKQLHQEILSIFKACVGTNVEGLNKIQNSLEQRVKQIAQPFVKQLKDQDEKNKTTFKERKFRDWLDLQAHFAIIENLRNKKNEIQKSIEKWDEILSHDLEIKCLTPVQASSRLNKTYSLELLQFLDDVEKRYALLEEKVYSYSSETSFAYTDFFNASVSSASQKEVNWERVFEECTKICLSCYQTFPFVKCDDERFDRQVDFNKLKDGSSFFITTPGSSSLDYEACVARITKRLELYEKAAKPLETKIEKLNAEAENYSTEIAKSVEARKKYNEGAPIWNSIKSKNIVEFPKLLETLDTEKINSADSVRGYTLLHFCIYHGFTEGVKLLKQKNANFSVLIEKPVLHIPLQKEKTHPLHLAVLTGDGELVKIVLEALSLKANDPCLSDALMYVINPDQVIDLHGFKDRNNRNFFATWEKNICSSIDVLLKKGANYTAAMLNNLEHLCGDGFNESSQFMFANHVKANDLFLQHVIQSNNRAILPTLEKQLAEEYDDDPESQAFEKIRKAYITKVQHQINLFEKSV